MAKKEIKLHAWLLVREMDKRIEPIVFCTKREAEDHLKKVVPAIVKAFASVGVDKKTVRDTIVQLAKKYRVRRATVIL